MDRIIAAIKERIEECKAKGIEFKMPVVEGCVVRKFEMPTPGIQPSYLSSRTAVPFVSIPDLKMEVICVTMSGNRVASRPSVLIIAMTSRIHGRSVSEADMTNEVGKVLSKLKIIWLKII